MGRPEKAHEARDKCEYHNSTILWITEVEEPVIVRLIAESGNDRLAKKIAEQTGDRLWQDLAQQYGTSRVEKVYERGDIAFLVNLPDGSILEVGHDATISVQTS